MDVRDRVVPGILRGQCAASFFGRQGLVRNGKQQGPLPFWTDTDYLGLSIAGHAGNRETAHPAGGGIVGMVLAAGGLSDDLGIGPVQMAEVIGQGDTGEASRGGRTAALADGDVVLDAKRQGNNLRPLSLEDLAIGAEDEVILQASADLLVASGSCDGEAGGRSGVDGDVEVHRQRSGVEGRA